MLIPIVIGLGVLSIFKGKAKTGPASIHGQLTPERSHLFQSALSSNALQPPHLEKLADAFAAQGLPAEALLLRKRAKLRAMPPEQKKERAAIFRKALASNDPDVIERIAAVYEAQGATGSAQTLRKQAIGIRTAKVIKPVQVAPEPVAAPVVDPSLETADAELVQAEASKIDPTSDSDESGDGISGN